MQVANALALALVDATAKSLRAHGDTPNNWIARSVAQKVDHPKAGTHAIPSTKVVSSRGTFTKY